MLMHAFLTVQSVQAIVLEELLGEEALSDIHYEQLVAPVVMAQVHEESRPFFWMVGASYQSMIGIGTA
jgi:hypothetical protein